jgi:phospholipase C
VLASARSVKLSLVGILAIAYIGVALAARHLPALGASAATAGQPTTPVKHVVVIFKENRSFDEYFGRFPGANGATTAKKHDGTIVSLAETPDSVPADPGHGPDAFRVAYDGGKMDGFDLERNAYSKTGRPLALSQMYQSDIPNYWAYASRYAIADRFFASWKGASFTNNLYAIAAQAGIYDPTLNGRSVYTIPMSPTQKPLRHWGCDSPDDTRVQMIDPRTRDLSSMYPCFNFPALPNRLSNNGISWHFYNTTGVQTVHNALDALKPVRYDTQLWSQVVPTTRFFTDLENNTLPSVSWIVGQQLEHPPASTCKGENQTVSYVNAIMNSPAWSSTAIFVVWDEWGGFYDHVAPPQLDGISYGFRVPLIAISPYTRAGSSSAGGSISSTTYSHESILKFIEDNWGLASMTPADARANDMMDMFDFSRTPNPRLVLPMRTCPSLTAAEKQLLRTRNPD